MIPPLIDILRSINDDACALAWRQALTDVDILRQPGPVTTMVGDATQPCCAPLAQAAISEAEADVLAARLKALADPARLRLVSLILATPEREACTCDLLELLGLSQPTVTHHLRKLADAGMVSGERRGRWTYYRVVPGALDAIARALRP
jgi:ArsR family transcriptional regulator